MFDQKKCLSAFIVYLNVVKEDPRRKLELYLQDGRVVLVQVPLPEATEEKEGTVILVDFKPKTA